MKKEIKHKKFIVSILLLVLIISNFGLTFAFWASSISDGQSNSDSAVTIGFWDFEDTQLVVDTFRLDHAYVLGLTESTVQISDKAQIDAALAEYGTLSSEAKALLTTDRDLLLSLLTRIIALENSEFLDFEAYAYDQGLTGTVVMNSRTWYGNAVYISNDPNYDVWNDTRSLALKMGAYFESRDPFINGIDTITIYHGALNYNNGATFQFKIEYELQSNIGTWLTLQDGGSDLLIDVLSATPLGYSEIPVNITEAIDIRFVPVISNTTDYINLDDITIFEHVVTSELEAETFRTVYASPLALTVGTVEISDKSSVLAALSAYDLLSVDAQNELLTEKALLDSLLVQIELEEDILIATNAVIYAESTNNQVDLDAAQVLVDLLPAGTIKTNLQARIDAVQLIINQVDLFLFDHQVVLALTTATVQLTDKTDVEAALADYALLSAGAKAELSAEKALLDDLLAEINSQVPTETLVLEFLANHAVALALTPATVQISNLAIVELALDAYDALTPAAQQELLTEKALLDSLLDQIHVLQATEAVVLAENSLSQSDLDQAQALVSALPAGLNKDLLQNRIDQVQAEIDSVNTFLFDHAAVLALTTETVTVSDKVAIENALSDYGLLTDGAKGLLTAEETLLLELLNEIIAFENSEFLDFEGFTYDNGLTGTVVMNGRTYYGNAVYIANDPNYDVWNDTRSLALKMGAYFESQDPFINGVDLITIYHGARNFNNGQTFQFKIEYELQSNIGTWLTLQDGGSDLLIDVLSATPLGYSEIQVNITEAVNIRFVPVISNTSDYINLDDIRIYEHVVSSALEVTTYQTLYAGVLALTTNTVTLNDQDAVASALASYDLLSIDAQNALLAEKALLDSLWVEIELLEDIEIASQTVILAENTFSQTDHDDALILVNLLPAGTTKTDLLNRLNAVQSVINEVSTFLSNHASALALNVLTVEVTDKPAVEAALASYALLSADAKDLLLSEKAHLDSLLAEINSQTPTEAQVLEFQTNHAIALALTVGTVQVSDRLIVEQALAAYDLLTPAAKAELLTEKALLDSLIAQIDILEATAEVVLAETTLAQIDHDNALVLVNLLPASTEKTNLISRLQAVQVTIDTSAAAYVDSLISALPVPGVLTLASSSDITTARTAYTALTAQQKTYVTGLSILVAAETEYANLNAATNAVIFAESNITQANKDSAQALVNVLTNGTPKTDLNNRLIAVQNILDVNQAQSIINTYFAANDVVVSTLNNNTVKQTAFLAKANEITASLGVTITVNSSTRVSRTNSTYNITITKGAASVTFVVSVTFTR